MKHMNHAMRATSEMDFVQLHLVDRLTPRGCNRIEWNFIQFA